MLLSSLPVCSTFVVQHCPASFSIYKLSYEGVLQHWSVTKGDVLVFAFQEASVFKGLRHSENISEVEY